jgi:bacterioferritin (cytochrome b1)
MDRLPEDSLPPWTARKQLIERLNEDLAREYQAIITHVVSSQTLKGAHSMHVAQELEKHASQELRHAMAIAKDIDYLGGMPTATAHLATALGESLFEMSDAG